MRLWMPFLHGSPGRRSGGGDPDNMWCRIKGCNAVGRRDPAQASSMARNDGFSRRSTWGRVRRTDRSRCTLRPYSIRLITERPIMLRRILMPFAVAVIGGACSDRPTTVEPVALPQAANAAAVKFWESNAATYWNGVARDLVKANNSNALVAI